MKKMKLILGAAMVVAAIAGAAQPVHATCLGALLDTVGGDPGETPIVSNPGWAAAAEPYFFNGAYGVAPISPSFAGFFWSQGTGNPQNGLGNDNGAYPSSEWVTFTYGDFTNGRYFYNAYMRNPVGGPINWTDGRVDGCSQPTACACVLFSDQWAGKGYFAMLADAPGAGFNYDFGFPGDISNGIMFALAPTPKPVITATAREPGTNHLLVSVTVPQPAAGLYQREGCNCVAGFRIFANVVTRGANPPSGRAIATDNWTLINTSTGSAQLVTPVGGTAQLRVDCGATNNDVYIATQLVGSDNFGTALVSENSTRIECGPNLADPIERPRVPLNRPPQGPTRDGRR